MLSTERQFQLSSQGDKVELTFNFKSMFDVAM